MADEWQLGRRGPLDGWAEKLAEASSDAFRIELGPFRTVINLRGAPADQSLVTDVQRTLGVELPSLPNRWQGDDRMAAVWLGPDEWLLVAPDGRAADADSALRNTRPDDPWLSLVDVSHNYIRFVLSGSKTRDVLAKGCPIDLHPEKFLPGDCAQTIVVKPPVLLRALVAGPSIEVWVRNSFAGYLASWLLDASADICQA